MKLKRITIHNIASIADAEIDFVASPLADTPLFLIAGPTGAGKSIILDSVCLALYARAPRLTRFKTDEKYEDSTLVGVEKEDDRNVGVDANRQLMRRSTVECFAKLLFEGNDGNDYEAQWHLHRSRNKATGKFQKEERTLTLLKTGETWTKKVDFEGKVQEVVGMKYEQFCRTSLLAQGEFTRFLQSKSDEKAEILERLTGIDIYSAVGRKIAEHAKAASDAYDRCCQAVAGISLLSDEEKAAVAEAIDVRKNALKRLRRRLMPPMRSVSGLPTMQRLKRNAWRRAVGLTISKQRWNRMSSSSAGSLSPTTTARLQRASISASATRRVPTRRH